MIELQNISKRLGQNQVLSELSVKVPMGQTYSLLGLSGSGKTTALKIACGLYLPDSGTVRLNGEEVQASQWPEQRKKLGYVIQGGGLFPHLTGRENLELVANEEDWDQARIDSRIQVLAEMAKISLSTLEQYPKELSGGQRQRVGLMRALLLDPPILLLDEALGALDPITRRELQEELRELFVNLKKTVLLVTHDLIEAGSLADHILLLRQGKIIQSGSLNDLAERPKDEFVRQFVSSYRIERGRL